MQTGKTARGDGGRGDASTLGGPQGRGSPRTWERSLQSLALPAPTGGDTIVSAVFSHLLVVLLRQPGDQHSPAAVPPHHAAGRVGPHRGLLTALRGSLPEAVPPFHPVVAKLEREDKESY